MDPEAPPADLHPRVYRYWDTMRGLRPMPTRGDLDPCALKPLLPHLVLLDVLADDFRYRLVGTRAARDFGHDVTGTLLGSHASSPVYAAAITGLCTFVRDHGQCVFAVGRYQTPAGLTHSVSSLVLPLGLDGRVSMLLVSRAARYAAEGTDWQGWLGDASGDIRHLATVSCAADVEREAQAWAGTTRPTPQLPERIPA